MTEVTRVYAGPIDITEGVQILLDAVVSSMDAGSGFLEYREWCAVRQLAWAMGLDPDTVCQRAGHWQTELANPGGWRAGVGRPLEAWEVRQFGFRASHAWPDPWLPLTDEPAGTVNE